MGINSQGVLYGQFKGGAWTKISMEGAGALQSVSVGDGKIIGVTKSNEIYYRMGINARNPFGTSWEFMKGKASRVTVGDGKIMAVQPDGLILYRLGVTAFRPYGTRWSTLLGRAKQISIGGGRIMSVRDDRSVWYRDGITATRSGGMGTEWKRLEGASLTQISCKNGQIFGVGGSGEIMYRTGMTGSASASGSFGSGWSSLGGKLSKVTYTGDKILGLTAAGSLATRPLEMDGKRLKCDGPSLPCLGGKG